MSLRIHTMVRSCKECPERIYLSGGAHRCNKTDTVFPASTTDWSIPSWCPLPLYPAPKGER